MNAGDRTRSGHPGRGPALLVATTLAVAGLAVGSSSLAQPGGVLDGVLAVSTSGKVRAIGVATAPARSGSAPVVDVALSPSGLGYLTIDRHGTTYAYGDVVRPGAARPPRTGVAAVAVEPTPSGAGAFVVFDDG